MTGTLPRPLTVSEYLEEQMPRQGGPARATVEDIEEHRLELKGVDETLEEVMSSITDIQERLEAVSPNEVRETVGEWWGDIETVRDTIKRWLEDCASWVGEPVR